MGLKERGEVKEPVYFNYIFRFDGGKEHVFKIELDPESLAYLHRKELKGSDWTRLEFHQCENCPLDRDSTPNCPVAVSLEELVEAFRDKFSYEEADIKVETPDRIYFKKTTMQKGLSSIMGILMVSSGCPILDKLRPMVRFHLPWATVLETTFRTTSTYLLGQFFIKKEGGSPDFSFDGLNEIYKDVRKVNKGMAERIRSMAGKDAAINALIILDIFASDIPFSLEDQLEELRFLFRPYFTKL